MSTLVTATIIGSGAGVLGQIVVAWFPILVLLGTYVVTMALSGAIVKAALRWTKHDTPLSDAKTARSGMLIGKCENILVVTLVFLDSLTALALIFAAKSLVRKDQIEDTEYYLGGTLVNVTWSMLVALLARWLIRSMV